MDSQGGRKPLTYCPSTCASLVHVAHTSVPPPFSLLITHVCDMSRPVHVSETPATQWLRRHAVEFEAHAYDYVERGGTAASAQALGIAEHAVIKTLVMEDQERRPLVVLMHGDCQVSTRELARQAGHKKVVPCDPLVAQRHSGYQVGGTSPFGLRKPLPVFVERSILALPRIWINGGRRGYLVSLSPAVLIEWLKAIPVDCQQTAG